MTRVLACLIMAVSLSAWAGEKNQSVTSKEIGQAVRKSWVEVMNHHFLQISNLASKHKTAREFMAAAMGDKADPEMLKSIPAKEMMPKITLIPNGMEMTSADGTRIKVRLGSTIGTTEIEGLKANNGKSAAAVLERLLRLLSPLPSADAGVWDWIWTRGGGNILKSLEESRRSPMRWGREVIPMTERLALLGKGTAYVSGEAAIFTCGVAIHFAEQEKVQACGQGALVGAGIVVGTVGFVSGGTAVLYGALVGTQKVIDAIPVAAKVAMMRVSGYVAKVGVAAAVAHGVDSLVKSDGIKLTCEDQDSGPRFQIEDLSLIDKNKPLISVRGDRVTFNGSIAADRPDGIEKYLKSHPDYKSLDEASLKALATSVRADLDQFAATCKKYGEGYTEIYRVESDKPAVEAAKGKAGVTE